MAEPKQPTTDAPATDSGSVPQAVVRVMEALVAPDDAKAEEEFEGLLTRARELIKRKQSKEGGRNETRDLIAELVFSRMRRAFRAFQPQADARDEIKAATWLMGSMFGTQTLTEFAAALDRAIVTASSPRDYSFAGLADFINIDEVLQLLGAGKHTGLLTLEKPDNRLDIYFSKGMVAFFDPYRFVRRVLPMPDRLTYREITPKLLEEAEQKHVREGVSIFFTLVERGFFKKGELRELVKTLGAEVLYEFLRQDSALAFYYKRMDELPEFAKKNDLRLPITPILLEGHKRFDEWISLKKVFPESDAPVKPLPDMFARISSLDLSVLEIKLLTLINGENSPEQIAPIVGLPLQDVYHLLVKFAREGVLDPPGGIDALKELSLSLEESMEAAFEALDANDDDAVVESALDRVLGANEANKSRDKALGAILDGMDKRK